MAFQGDNPYQPPVAEQAMGGGQFSISRATSEAWTAVTQNLGTCIVAGLVFGVLTILAAVTIIGYFVVVPVLAWGAVLFTLNLHAGRASVNDIFAGFSNYGTALGRMLLLVIIYLLLNLFTQGVSFIGMAMDSVVVQLIGFVIQMAFLFIVVLRVYFAAFYIVDKDETAVDAFTRSWNATSGQTVQVFLLALATLGVMLAGALALGVGLFVAIPMTYVMWASAYRQIEGERVA